MKRLLAALVVVLVASACGGARQPDTYKLAPTKTCLQEADVRVSTRAIDFVASTALGGALNAKFRGNEVTLAFGDSPDAAERTERAYRRFAPDGLKPKIDDVLRRERNVVLLWAVAPSEEQRRTVVDCLRG